MQVSILAITDGQVIEYPPEIYLDAEQAIREAKHWAWVLSAGGEFEIRRPFEGRWEVGIRDIRVVGVAAQDFDSGRDWWVGVHWVADGYPDPDCVLLDGGVSARQWVLAAVAGGGAATTSQEDPWSVSATFAARGGESESVALRAKVIAAQSRTPLRSSADYEVHLVGTFVQSIHGQVEGPPGLVRSEIEELVDRNWAMLSTETDVLLDSSWELESFRELES